jgi:hypothetical protein
MAAPQMPNRLRLLIVIWQVDAGRNLCSIEKDFSKFFAAAKEGVEKWYQEERRTSAAKATW